MLQPGFKTKFAFFDGREVLDKTEQARRRELMRFGAYVRTRIISSMLGHKVGKSFGVKSKVTDREGPSAPGQPPHPHSGLLVKGEEFDYGRSSQSVIIGPKLLNGQLGNAPEALEYGGPSVVRVSRRETRTVNIRARPSAVPAFQIELEKMPSMWRDSIR